MEKPQIDGFILEGQAKSNVISASGVVPLQFIAIADSPDDAIGIVGNLGFPGAKVIDSGPDVLHRARALGVPKDSAKSLNAAADLEQE